MVRNVNPICLRQWIKRTRKVRGFFPSVLVTKLMVRITDAKGHQCIEIDLPSGKVRLTYLVKGWSDSPSVRIQVRQPNGHLRLGPEIPVVHLGDFVKSLLEGTVELLSSIPRTRRQA